MKLCSSCKDPYKTDPSYFPKDKTKKDGLDSRCRTCKNISKRAQYAKSSQLQAAKKREIYKKNRATIRDQKRNNYRTNKRTYLSRKYSSIHAHLRHTKSYRGRKCTFTREEFIAFGLASESFHKIWDSWVASNYARSESPSVDRILENGNYTFDNIQFLPFGENAAKGNTENEVAGYHTEPEIEEEPSGYHY